MRRRHSWTIVTHLPFASVPPLPPNFYARNNVEGSLVMHVRSRCRSLGPPSPHMRRHEPVPGHPKQVPPRRPWPKEGLPEYIQRVGTEHRRGRLASYEIPIDQPVHEGKSGGAEHPLPCAYALEDIGGQLDQVRGIEIGEQQVQRGRRARALKRGEQVLPVERPNGPLQQVDHIQQGDQTADGMKGKGPVGGYVEELPLRAQSEDFVALKDRGMAVLFKGLPAEKSVRP